MRNQAFLVDSDIKRTAAPRVQEKVPPLNAAGPAQRAQPYQ
jgi:hypothetical protein